MLIAFYAPMKPPTHQVPSGDRRMARLLMAALRHIGHEAALASELRTYDPAGDSALQRHQAAAGAAEAARIISDWSQRPPDAWLTYHVYHKAPDFVGPAVARHFGIPYLIAEPSVAPKRAAGPWSYGYEVAGQCLHQADALLCLTRLDTVCVSNFLGTDARVQFMPPFLDVAPFAQARNRRLHARETVASRWGLDPGCLWLLAVGMMRSGDKLESYRQLARALSGLEDNNWQLLVVGDGPERPSVSALMKPLESRVFLPGACPPEDMPDIYAASDVCVWPAQGEAYGMALIEAAAAGVPVIAGRVRGVPDIVMDGKTGLLVPGGDAEAMAMACKRLINDEALRQQMGDAAARFAAAERDIAAGAAILDSCLRRMATPNPMRRAAP